MCRSGRERRRRCRACTPTRRRDSRSGSARPADPLGLRPVDDRTRLELPVRSSLLDGGIHRPGARGSPHADTVAARVESQPLRPRRRRPLRRVRLWATWPAIRHVDDAHYLARPAAGYGEAAAGDHLQLDWAFWLVGHQLERGGVAGRRPVFVPARGGGAAEPPGLAARAPLLAARRGASGTCGRTT